MFELLICFDIGPTVDVENIMYSCILGGIQYINAPMSTPAKPSAFNF